MIFERASIHCGYGRRPAVSWRGMLLVPPYHGSLTLGPLNFLCFSRRRLGRICVMTRSFGQTAGGPIFANSSEGTKWQNLNFGSFW